MNYNRYSSLAVYSCKYLITQSKFATATIKENLNKLNKYKMFGDYVHNVIYEWKTILMLSKRSTWCSVFTNTKKVKKSNPKLLVMFFLLKI